jgi:phospholipid-translocating ATPase
MDSSSTCTSAEL